ncbi:MAG: bifunctional methylenetetrahydrofolate dehydrogenase/methenyltetrahydrofolate cyclohydrolase FolD [Xanthobacteraceae bacterium]|nr:bifunctional methylenetetrahydrofolate dehydrogenase/methenyltetrahydrofolate cyclohydrolase FolD [Xanthobacteraceae bacterium]
MSAQIIDGAACAAALRERVRVETSQLKAATGTTPTLAVVLVGDDPASQVYVRSKSRQAESIGLKAVDYRLPSSTEAAELLALVKRLNSDAAVHGILVQLPLPKHIPAADVLRAIDPTKDVDGFHPINAGFLASGDQDNGLIPCTPLGSLLLLKTRFVSLSGLNALVLGRSTIVGRPMAQLLINESCTVAVAHSKTSELKEHCRRADILIAAVGRPEFVRGDWIKPGATVIDVGINRITRADGTSALVGDVAWDEATAVAAAITPVPGGVGPMTIACLLANTVTAAYRHAGMATPPRDMLTGHPQLMPA